MAFSDVVSRSNRSASRSTIINQYVQATGNTFYIVVNQRPLKVLSAFLCICNNSLCVFRLVLYSRDFALSVFILKYAVVILLHLFAVDIGAVIGDVNFR